MALSFSAFERYQNPYPLYQQLRHQNPVAPIDHALTGNAWFVTRYDDVQTVLKDARFSNERRKAVPAADDRMNSRWMPSMFRAFTNSMLMLDDPDHRRLRMLVHQAFTPRMIEQLSVRIEEICSSLLDAFSGKPVVDLIESFALPLPLTVISEMMGVPPQERLKFRKWTNGIVNAPGRSKWNLVKQMPTAMAMQRYFNKLIALRRSSPQDDLITGLVRAEENGDQLSQEELVAMLFLLLFAGHETTVNLIGNGTLALLEHPEQLEKLEAEPALIDSAIEEMLRYTSPVQQIAQRYALEPVELSGQIVPKGDIVFISIASANRDETVFENADQFDITRSPNKHLGFGQGIHYCLGAPLARVEAKIAFGALLSRFPHLTLAVPADQLKWRGNIGLRGLEALPVRIA